MIELSGFNEEIKMVELTICEYENLVRNSEKLAIIARMLKANDYVSAGDLKSILGNDSYLQVITKNYTQP